MVQPLSDESSHVASTTKYYQTSMKNPLFQEDLSFNTAQKFKMLEALVTQCATHLFNNRLNQPRYSPSQLLYYFTTSSLPQLQCSEMSPSYETTMEPPMNPCLCIAIGLSRPLVHSSPVPSFYLPSSGRRLTPHSESQCHHAPLLLASAWLKCNVDGGWSICALCATLVTELEKDQATMKMYMSRSAGVDSTH